MKKMITMDFKKSGNIVYVIGKTEGHLDQSIFAKDKFFNGRKKT